MISKTNKYKALRFGYWSEVLAAMLLIFKGYRILARRHRTSVGEIDLIAKRRSKLVFVEVKARQTQDDAAFSLTHRQRLRLLRAAEHFMARNRRYAACVISCDVILVHPGGLPHYIPNAFSY
jgi:putative endonuclease